MQQIEKNVSTWNNMSLIPVTCSSDYTFPVILMYFQIFKKNHFTQFFKNSILDTKPPKL